MKKFNKIIRKLVCVTGTFNLISMMTLNFFGFGSNNKVDEYVDKKLNIEYLFKDSKEKPLQVRSHPTDFEIVGYLGSFLDRTTKYVLNEIDLNVDKVNKLVNVTTIDTSSRYTGNISIKYFDICNKINLQNVFKKMKFPKYASEPNLDQISNDVLNYLKSKKNNEFPNIYSFINISVNYNTKLVWIDATKIPNCIVTGYIELPYYVKN